MELQKISTELRELTFDQVSNINGGESAWYWIGLGIGSIGRSLKIAVSKIDHDPNHMSSWIDK
ncbi:MAG: hypothetical protein EAZ13_04050 [Sphingobacteriia bacterium]|nr:MAG: hypothetical protein EAZ35_07605 [Sphingobacteriia bacterium]TAH08203.1 MAG: hypothetical protein EAZ13_04050 [Sphingobacteriia bacterium]